MKIKASFTGEKSGLGFDFFTVSDGFLRLFYGIIKRYNSLLDRRGET